MKKARNRQDPDPSGMPTNVDFSSAVRGKYARRFSGDVKVVVLDPDVSSAFPDAESVNRALRSLVRAKKHKTA